jgi:hypothetical protein
MPPRVSLPGADGDAAIGSIIAAAEASVTRRPVPGRETCPPAVRKDRRKAGRPRTDDEEAP